MCKNISSCFWFLILKMFIVKKGGNSQRCLFSYATISYFKRKLTITFEIYKILVMDNTFASVPTLGELLHGTTLLKIFCITIHIILIWKLRVTSHFIRTINASSSCLLVQNNICTTRCSSFLASHNVFWTRLQTLCLSINSEFQPWYIIHTIIFIIKI